MFNQIFNKKVVVPFFQFVGIIAIFTFIVFPGLTAADTIVNIFSAIIGFFTMLALFYFVTNWFQKDEPKNEIGETELDYIPKPKAKRKPKVTKSEFPVEPHTKTVKKATTKKTK
jgi:energy-coupling factor transporter transmembrane protein EcfT